MNNESNKNHVLIIYQMIPDNIQIYDMSVNDEDLKMLKECHGEYGNSVGIDEDHPVNKLHDWLEDRNDYRIYDAEKDNTKLVGSIGNKEIIVTGFLL